MKDKIDRKELANRFLNAFNLLSSKGILHTYAALAEAIGKTESQISSGMKGTPKLPTKNMLLRVADAFPDIINRKYMETGEGDIALPDPSSRPHVEDEARAGFMVGLSTPDAGMNFKSLVSFVPAYDFTINAKGDSMEPVIHDGDLLLCRVSDDRYNVPYDKICVIDSKDGAAVKIFRQGDSNAVLHSINAKYKDYEIPYEDINGISEVVAVIHNMMNKTYPSA